HTASMDASRTPSRRAFSSQTSAEGPTSKRTERASEPRLPVTSTEKPWHARHTCPQGSTQSWSSMGARWGRRATSRPSSGSCGTPLSTLDSVSLSLSTTTSKSSASSAAISTGFISLSSRLATLIKSLHQITDDAQRTERTQRDVVKAHQTRLAQREFLQNAFRLFRCACVDNENHTLPVGLEIPLVYFAREISIHRVMHFMRHDLGALGGCHGRANEMGDRQDLRGGHSRQRVLR